MSVSDRHGWRMASEDSRYRDRARRFSCSVRAAIRRRPTSPRCSPCCMSCSTRETGGSPWPWQSPAGGFRKTGQRPPRGRCGASQRNATSHCDGCRAGCSRSMYPRRSTPRGAPAHDVTAQPGIPRTRAGTASRDCTPSCADTDREAAFAVNEADDPLLEAWPFLLIVRTGRIVTPATHPPYRLRQRYRRILGVSSI